MKLLDNLFGLPQQAPISRIANRLSNMRLLETDSSMGYYKLVPHTWK